MEVGIRGSGSLGAGVSSSGVVENGWEESMVVEDLEEVEVGAVGFWGLGSWVGNSC